jgi:hypothetical protein
MSDIRYTNKFWNDSFTRVFKQRDAQKTLKNPNLLNMKYMFKNKIQLLSLLYVGLVIYGCTTVETGFLSKNLYYIDNPLYTTQGTVTVSTSLVVDGSTLPMTIELTKVTNEGGEDVTEMVSKPDSIIGFSGSITYADSTLALLNAKLVKTIAVPLSVNKTGGRIQLTPATKSIPTGEYDLSLKASNVRGTVDLPNICKVIVTGSGDTYTDFGGAYAGAFDPSTGVYLYGVGLELPKVKFTKTDVNKIIYKFLDKDGNKYNPKAGGLTVRKNRWTMKQFDPYFKEVLTDSTVEYGYPTVPNTFPVFLNPGINGIIPRGTYGVFPAIPGARNSSGDPVFAFLDLAFLDKGTYVIVVQFTDVTWK